MNIIEFYQSILESLGLTVDDRGGVCIYSATGEDPYIVKDKRLVLPTQDFLKNPDWNTKIAFHPLSENIARKDSDIFKMLQSLGNISVVTDIGYLMRTLIRYCADTQLHSKLNPKQQSFLSLFPDADETSLKNWDKIEAKIGTRHVYAKIITLRDKKIGRNTYPRAAFVTFPFYEDAVKLCQFKQKEYVIFDVKVRKKDIHGYKALFEYLISHLDNVDEHYTSGSRSMVAPSFHAFINAYYKLKKELNRTYKMMKLESTDLLWGKHIDDITKYNNVIPPLAGNEGDIVESEKRQQSIAINNPVPVAPPTPTAPAVVPPPQPVSQSQQPQAQAAPVNPYKPQAPAVHNPRNIPVLTPPQPQQSQYAQPPSYPAPYGQGGQYPVYGQPVAYQYPPQGWAPVVDRNGRALPPTNQQVWNYQQHPQYGYNGYYQAGYNNAPPSGWR